MKVKKELLEAVSRYIEENYIDPEYAFSEEDRVHIDLLGSDSGGLGNIRSIGTSDSRWEDLFDEKLDVGFSETLFMLIDRSGKTDPEVYNAAHIDRRLFSKIRNEIDYKPTKPTVLSFAFALELNLEETEDLLRRAGLALSPSSKFDLIVEYFLQEQIHDLFLLNETLDAHHQPLIGC